MLWLSATSLIFSKIEGIRLAVIPVANPLASKAEANLSWNYTEGIFKFGTSARNYANKSSFSEVSRVMSIDTSESEIS